MACPFLFVQEGMFNNANVIFRTKFVDGVSAVTRTVTQRGRAEQQQQKGRCVAQKRKVKRFLNQLRKGSTLT
eukprot:1160280-Pelagomonas_calceolata.AAC.7